ncbi:MAG: hypothetical protein ACKO2G_06605 [Verrucomicrobiales bacterium]
MKSSILCLPLLIASLTPDSLAAGVSTGKNPVVLETSDSGWWFRVAPYVWLTATEGDAGIAGFEAPVDIGFDDTLDTLDLGFMAVFEAGKGKWSLGLDGIYATFSQDVTTGGRLFKSGEFEQTQLILTPRVSYNLIQTPDYRMDILAGARWTMIDYDLTLRLADGQISRGTDEDWMDPVIGVRGRWYFTEKASLTYSGDIGGFGVGSDLTWQAFLGLGYRFTPGITGVIGYRGLGIDYKDDGFTLDTVAHGPLVGLEVIF